MADYLQTVAAFVHGGRRPKACEMELALAAWNRTTENLAGNDRPRLVRRLVGQVRDLA